MSDQNDHDVLVKLVQSVDDFHAEMRRSLDDLKHNYSSRLSAVEDKTDALEISNSRQNTMLVIGSSLLSILTGVVIYRIFKT